MMIVLSYLAYIDEREQAKKKGKCIIRESNTGLVDGNNEFYH